MFTNTGESTKHSEHVIRYPGIERDGHFADIMRDRRAYPEMYHCVIQRGGSTEIPSVLVCEGEISLLMKLFPVLRTRYLDARGTSIRSSRISCASCRSVFCLRRVLMSNDIHCTRLNPGNLACLGPLSAHLFRCNSGKRATIAARSCCARSGLSALRSKSQNCASVRGRNSVLPESR